MGIEEKQDQQAVLPEILRFRPWLCPPLTAGCAFTFILPLLKRKSLILQNLTLHFFLKTALKVQKTYTFEAVLLHFSVPPIKKRA